MKSEKRVLQEAGIDDLSEVFDPNNRGHIKEIYLKDYVRNKIKMSPAYRQAIDSHLLNVCNGVCQEMIDEVVRGDRSEDWKLSQIPEGDR